MRRFTLILSFLLILAASACGKKGGLYLPDEEASWTGPPPLLNNGIAINVPRGTLPAGLIHGICERSARAARFNAVAQAEGVPRGTLAAEPC